MSDTNGNYGFTNLEPQSYLLRVSQDTAWYLSPLNIGTNDAIDNDFNESGYLVVECTDLEVDLFLDCGLYKNLTVGGTIWVEGDDNGNQDAGENGAAGVEVELLNAADSVVGTDFTDSNEVRV